VELLKHHSVNQETCRKKLPAADIVLALIVLGCKAENAYFAHAVQENQ
jgi:hypothetical protein